MSYSPLCSKIIPISTYTTGRKDYKMAYIGIHHMAGNCSGEDCARILESRGVSAHYGVDVDGNIFGYVDEDNTAWALGNFVMNERSINIEMANDTNSTSYTVSDATIEATIKLVADIAKRFNWTYISFTGDLDGDLIGHRYVVSTSCPGPYITDAKLKYMAEKAEKYLTGELDPEAYVPIDEDGLFGLATGRATQKLLGSKYSDGIMSAQMEGAKEFCTCVCNGAFEFSETEEEYAGSPTVIMWQKYIGMSLDDCDGLFGPNSIKQLKVFLNKEAGTAFDTENDIFDEETCKAWQAYLNKKLSK